jgi:hypothetical protein
VNQRIQELYKQAHVTETKQVRKGGWDNDREPFEYSSVTTTVFNPEKFAQLIVRECTKVLTQHGSYFSGEGEPYHYAASLIEEHFGVEE